MRSLNIQDDAKFPKSRNFDIIKPSANKGENKMAKFIDVREYKTNTYISVNVNEIESVRQINDECTEITFKSGRQISAAESFRHISIFIR